jgi:hypothetical protein
MRRTRSEIRKFTLESNIPLLVVPRRQSRVALYVFASDESETEGRIELRTNTGITSAERGIILYTYTIDVATVAHESFNPLQWNVWDQGDLVNQAFFALSAIAGADVTVAEAFLEEGNQL